jgi:hypothetical protein
MKIKAIRVLALSLTSLLLAAPNLKAQDLSKYREFSLGANLANVLKRTDKKLSDVNTMHSVQRYFRNSHGGRQACPERHTGQIASSRFFSPSSTESCIESLSDMIKVPPKD